MVSHRIRLVGRGAGYRHHFDHRWSPFFGPKARALTNRTFELTPQRLERGRYIAMGLSSCVYFHSPHDWTSAGTPIVAGKEASGEVLPYAGLPGRIVAPNLTPDRETGAGSWTDDQLARAIREGVGHDGRALFPIMPYQHYRNMSDEDLASVVVYLRSLPAVHNKLPATEISFPVKYLIRSAPVPIAAPVADVVSSDQNASSANRNTAAVAKTRRAITSARKPEYCNSDV